MNKLLLLFFKLSECQITSLCLLGIDWKRSRSEQWLSFWGRSKVLIELKTDQRLARSMQSNSSNLNQTNFSKSNRGFRQRMSWTENSRNQVKTYNKKSPLSNAPLFKIENRKPTNFDLSSINFNTHLQLFQYHSDEVSYYTGLYHQ